jgi:hypothetical protein
LKKIWNVRRISGIKKGKFEKDGHLSEEDANALTDQIVDHFLCRQGPLLKKETYDVVAKETSECVNALLIGPDYNHIAYSLHELNVSEWFGVDIIDVIDAFLRYHEFEMLPEIQGEPGTILRQTSTKAEAVSFDVDDGNGKLLKIKSPSKFIELIQRGPIRDDKGKIIIKKGSIERFQSFISKNTVKIYEATRLN